MRKILDAKWLPSEDSVDVGACAVVVERTSAVIDGRSGRSDLVVSLMAVYTLS